MPAARSFTVRRDDDQPTEDLADDDVLLKKLKARIAVAAGFFEVLDFCKENEGDKAEIDFLAELGKEHWNAARKLIHERRELDRARSRPPRIVAGGGAGEAATGK